MYIKVDQRYTGWERVDKWRSKGRGTEKSENQINELCLLVR